MQDTLWRGLGALVGGAVGVLGGIGIRSALESGFLPALAALAVLVVVEVILYMGARANQDPASAGGEVLPGGLLGVTTGINVVLITAIAGIVPAIVICLIPMLAIVEPIARSDVYQAFVGWANWLLPMSWPIVALGLVLMLVSLLGGLIGLAGAEFFKVSKFFLDWKTGTFFLQGGIAGNANLNPNSTGYNMGDFAFLRKDATGVDYLTEHEAGHTLNLAAFGFVVHLIGALDENVFGGHNAAYTELFAESNVPVASRQGPIFPWWGAPL
jgi:hypothetical protein